MSDEVRPNFKTPPVRLDPKAARAEREACRSAAGGICARCHTATGASGQAHHLVTRSRGGSDTADNLAWVCRPCHDWIHAHPNEARATGLLRARR